RRRLELLLNVRAITYGMYICLAIGWVLLAGKEKLEIAPAAIALYCSGTVIFRAAALRKKLYGVDEFSIFMALPVADLDFSRLLWKKFVLRSSEILVLSTSIYLAQAFAGQAGASLGRTIIASLTAGFLQWLLVCSLVVLALRLRIPALIYLGLALYGLIGLGIFLPSAFAHQLHAFTAVLPAGWINLLYESVITGKMAGLLWFIPVLALAAASLSQLARVRDTYTVLQRDAILSEQDPSPEAPVPGASIADLADSELLAEKTHHQSMALA